jgi:4-amino-4-deoxy-L-arabinose transferase-like glycosyltransferase
MGLGDLSVGTALKKSAARQSRRGATAVLPAQSNVSPDWSRHWWSFLHLESSARARCFLTVLTCACLLPFLGEAFHVDDTLFVWAAKHIAQHPLDPYGFSVVWYGTEMPMSEVTKNPPLAAYILALVGSWAGWSEQVLHLTFLVFSVAVILGVYELARDMTRSPVLAACLTLATPGFLVSATSVMSDVPMLAAWLFAIVFWRRGIREGKPRWLAASSVLIGVCSLAKYFGVSLIPLLLLYSIWSKRRMGIWSIFLVPPIVLLAGYQAWTASLYGHGLLSGLVTYVNYARAVHPASTIGTLLVGLSFVGGCTLPSVLFAPRLWPWRWIIVAGLLAILGAAGIVWGWVSVENPFPDQHRTLLALQLGLFLLGGISTLGLAFYDFWRRRDADSVLLAAWVLGTFVFAALLNWTVNARSVLPLIPAAGLLIVRRLDDLQSPRSFSRSVVPIVLCLAVSLWVTSGDAALANSARTAALEIHNRGARDLKRILFSGHWGFQYYMESLGGQVVDPPRVEPTMLDLFVRAENNTNQVLVQAGSPSGNVSIEIRSRVTTMRPKLGAGFYSSAWGPLPYAFAPVPDERYDFFRFDGVVGADLH